MQNKCILGTVTIFLHGALMETTYRAPWASSELFTFARVLFPLDSCCCCAGKGRKNRLLPSNRYHRYLQCSLPKSTLLCTLTKRQRMEEVEGSTEEFIKDNIK